MDIAAIVSQMTLEEKAGLCSGLDHWRTKPIERLGVPSVMLSDGPHGLRKQRDDASAGVDDSIEAVCFPTGSALGASFDRDLVKTVGEALGDACAAEDVACLLGPAVNSKRSPLCGRNFEYFSEDPYLSGELAVSEIQGVQSRGVAACVKHFCANNQEHRRMSVNVEADMRTLREIYLPAFEAAVAKGGARMVMGAYNRVNGAYMCENRPLLSDVLRGEWGFDGVAVSDWGAVNDRVAGLAAGLDLEMPASGGRNDRKIVEAVREGWLAEDVLDAAVTRILRLIDQWQREKRETVWDKAGQHALSRRVAAECMVLLKNDGALLPLDKQAKIAFIGPFAAQPRFQGGGSSHVNSFRVLSALDAVSDMENISYAEGCTANGDEIDDRLMARAVKAARRAKATIVFAGLPDSYECEGYDRTHLRLPENQNELIRRVAAANKNTVVVLHNGAPVEMPWLGSVRAVLEAYLGGQAVGGAVRDVLFGDMSPAGRLAETFPLHLADCPAMLYGSEGDRAEYREGIFTGYRYYDKKEMPVLFPFGYGLSYTAFQYENLRLSAEKLEAGQSLSLTVDVKNVGMRAGKEVVQAYAEAPEGAFSKPVRTLAGFEKVALMPGETRTVTVTLARNAFSRWSETANRFVRDAGGYGVAVGASSRDIRCRASVEVAADYTEKPVWTANSIVADLMANADAAAVLQPLLTAAMAQVNAGGAAAQAAITPEMTMAMLRYMPLRAAVQFGYVTEEQLQGLLMQLNAEK